MALAPRAKIGEDDVVTNGVEVTFYDITQSMHNFLRHALFKDVPILAVDTVTFVQYDGPLESEMISHRIGQLPVRLVHGDTESTTATFSVEVVAPPHDEKCGLMWITSDKVVCTSENAHVVHYRSAAEKSMSKYDTGFLLAPLHPGERLQLTFSARVSTGREATRWVSCFIKPSMDPFRLYIETTGAITPREALRAALQTSIERLHRLTRDLNC